MVWEEICNITDLNLCTSRGVVRLGMALAGENISRIREGSSPVLSPLCIPDSGSVGRRVSAKIVTANASLMGWGAVLFMADR